eukprot:GFYU01004714.1.p1 GENE.GFYU01004714.1~~GFYU01004714.1.p1  ORF type:complete len:222 (-),score=52.34 GFYU01004714.1:171-836(-)
MSAAKGQSFADWKKQKHGGKTPRAEGASTKPKAGKKGAAHHQKGLKYSVEDVMIYKQIFDEYDNDGSGVINKAEMRQALADNPDYQKFAGSMFDVMDRDGSNEIDFREFISKIYSGASAKEIDRMVEIACRKPPTPEPEPEKKLTDEQIAEIKGIFRVYDVDGSGSISVDELKKAFKPTGYSDDEIAAMFAQFDSSGDKLVDVDEFIELMKDSYLKEPTPP